jgi:hypothetical protein
LIGRIVEVRVIKGYANSVKGALEKGQK